jgi:uncharacterized membrane protein
MGYLTFQIIKVIVILLHTDNIFKPGIATTGWNSVEEYQKATPYWSLLLLIPIWILLLGILTRKILKENSVSVEN